MKNNKKFSLFNRNHYKKVALKEGSSLISTINDIKVRNLEIEKIISFIDDDSKILDCGCGNGSVTNLISKKTNSFTVGFDASKPMITVAKKFEIKNKKVKYLVKNICNINYKNKFDFAYTIRVIQNLNDGDKLKAIKNIYNCLKDNGIALFIETTSKSQKNLNRGRSEVGLSKIPVFKWNILLNETKFKKQLKQTGFKILKIDNFLSGYYFWSRIILPLITKNPKKISSSNYLNEYFIKMPSFGDFGGHKLFVVKKKL